jgi:UDP-N-acetylmuramoyl-L-alanyl-D-glutamate--2,6-diaminopimelate ligase
MTFWLKLWLYRLKAPFHFVKTGLLNGLWAQMRYRNPQRRLQVLCITGTDGKTTSSTLLYHVLKTAGLPVALVSTVAAYIGEQTIDTGFHVTSPAPSELYKFMDRMLHQGIQYLVLETTSQGIYQYRTWGINPYIAGLTNITGDHLDYHVTYDLYVAAKTKLFQNAAYSVLNKDDESYLKVRKLLQNSQTSILPYSLSDPAPAAVKRSIAKRFPESYNQSNARLVWQIAQILHIKPTVFAKAMESFPGVPGRMETVAKHRGVEVIVDFAHTANALDEALTAIRQQMKKNGQKRLIAVYGCAGLRDTTKRPAMGHIGAEKADLAIFTAEDPRTENIWSIIRQMKQDVAPFHHKVVSIADRGAAIHFALASAQRGDVIGIFGKGHEQSMCYGTIEYPWNDAEFVRTELGLSDSAA